MSWYSLDASERQDRYWFKKRSKTVGQMADDDLRAPLAPGAGAEPDCSDGVWSMPPPAARRLRAAAASSETGPTSDVESATDRKSVAASLAALLLALPALVGSWCWPLLLAGFMGITATAGAKAFSHTFSLAFTLAILTNLAQYFAWKGNTRRGTHWQRYGPAWLLVIATPLVCADMTRHCLQDSGVWTGESSRMYRPGCGPVSGLHGILCLSVTGLVFSILFTYSGFILMITAVVWSSGLRGKLRAAWGELRAGAGASASASGPGQV